MLIDFNNVSPNQRYHTITQTLIPRPIAWVLTDNGDASYNLAPFSYFTAVASDPALLMISVGKKTETEPKDTRKNCLARPKFVIHIPRSDQAEALNESARSRPFGDSEITAGQLALTDFNGFAIPRLEDCAVAYACELHKVDDITASQTLIFGQVQQVYIDDACAKFNNDRLNVDATAIDPLTRLGGANYASIGKPFTLARPK
jgi:flavin reductase (DIM6/NTAB) family NADH-FMN oxidoreductase RutF